MTWITKKNLNGPLKTKIWIMKKIQEKKRKKETHLWHSINTSCYSTVPESNFTVYATQKTIRNNLFKKKVILRKEKKKCYMIIMPTFMCSAVQCSADSWLVRMSTKLAPNKITDLDKTKILNKDVCRLYKFGYCKFLTTCRNKHIETECEDKDCDKKFLNRHIKSCWYGSRCKQISDCEFKHI